jgi:hypothetical protein
MGGKNRNTERYFFDQGIIRQGRHPVATHDIVDLRLRKLWWSLSLIFIIS